MREKCDQAVVLRAVLCTIALSTFLTGANAQEAGEDAFELDVLVIEGGKVPRDFLNTPDSVAVATGDDIERRGIDDLRDSFSQFGNVRLFEGNRGENGFVIRGLNSDGVTESFNNAPLTSVIIDGATQSVEATRRGARGLWDVEQLEIYRGPQSTLQGRGALAGAVIINTKDPTFEPEYAFKGVVGDLDRLDGAFAVSGPIIEDQLAFRISAERRFKRRGISFNIPENETIGEDEYRNIRGKLLYTPIGVPGLTLKFTISDTYDKPGIASVNSADFFDREFNVGAVSSVEIREANNRNYVLEASYRFDNGMELTSISAFADSETSISSPAGGRFFREEDRGGEDFTQDLRLTFGEDEDTLSGVIGLYYGRFTLPRESIVSVDNGATEFVFQDFASNDNTTNRSVYADLRWRFARRYILLAGGRYTKETVTEEAQGVRNQLRLADGTPTTPGLPIDENISSDFSVFLPKFGLAYEISDTQTISLVAQKGYRSGFNEINETGVNKVDPEFLWSYEIGYRAEDPAGRWRLGATAFYSEYRDQQLAVPAQPPAISRTVNAGRSEIYGAEVEGSYAFDNGFDLFGSLGLLKTRFREFETASRDPDDDGDLAGNEFPESPNVTASLGFSYSNPSGFFAGATASYTASYFSTGSIENDSKLKIPSFTRVDAQVGYDFGNAQLVAYVDNLFDKDYVTSLSNTAFGREPVEATVSEPRTIGVEFRMKF